MSAGFWVSYALLWVLVLTTLAGMLALYYYQALSVTNQRSRAQTHGPELGTAAPASNEPTLAGRPAALGGAKPSQSSVVFVSLDCRPCELVVRTIATVPPQEHTEIVVVCKGSHASVDAFASTWGLNPAATVADADGQLARRWTVLSTPFVVKLDKAGVVTQRGNPSNADQLYALLDLVPVAATEAAGRP